MIKQVLDELIQKREQVAETVARAQSRVADAQRDLDALDRVIALLEQRPRQSRVAAPPVPADAIRGMSVEDAAVYIAKQCQRKLSSTPARKVMIAAGVLRNTSHAATDLYRVLNESDRFEQERRGQYRLMHDADEDSPPVHLVDARMAH